MPSAMNHINRAVAQPQPTPTMAGRPRCTERKKRSEEHTSELQSLMRISYAVFCVKKKKKKNKNTKHKEHYNTYKTNKKNREKLTQKKTKNNNKTNINKQLKSQSNTEYSRTTR